MRLTRQLRLSDIMFCVDKSIYKITRFCGQLKFYEVSTADYMWI